MWETVTVKAAGARTSKDCRQTQESVRAGPGLSSSRRMMFEA